MKFSVVFLVQPSSRWAHPRASATSLAEAALPGGKLPVPAASVFHPPGLSSGMVSKAGHWRRMEREEAESNPQPFPPAKPGCLNSPHCFFQSMCGSTGESQPAFPYLVGEVGGASILQGAGEGVGSQAVPQGK